MPVGRKMAPNEHRLELINEAVHLANDLKESRRIHALILVAQQGSTLIVQACFTPW
jgi:hypothetical protein